MVNSPHFTAARPGGNCVDVPVVVACATGVPRGELEMAGGGGGNAL